MQQLPFSNKQQNTIPQVTVYQRSQISVYVTHKNVAVRKIMHAMRTAYAKRPDMSQTKHDATITEHT